MSMPAISLHQPWASLCVTRQPCWLCDKGLTHVESNHREPMVKRFETRSWSCPPNLIGQRIALHATKRDPDSTGAPQECWDAFDHGDPLPTGAIVGFAVIEACYPIFDSVCLAWGSPCILVRSDSLWLYYEGSTPGGDNVSDQLPYGDFTPGRYAWLLADAAPVQERCPWCRGEGGDPDSYESLVLGAPEVATKACRVCDGSGRCEPIPAKGSQRIWRWTP